MSTDVLRWSNFIVCLISLIPVWALVSMLWKERAIAKKRKILNAILIFIIVSLGVRAIVQIILYGCVLFRVHTELVMLNSGALLSNLLSTLAIWFLWIYIRNLE